MERLFRLRREQAAIAIFTWLTVMHLATAAPFRKQIEYTQPDGTVVQLAGRGDEFHAVFETLDGYTVTFDRGLKAYCYARLSSDGRQLVSTGVLAGRGDVSALGLTPHLRIPPEAARLQAAAARARWDQEMEVSTRWNALKAAMRASVAGGDSLNRPPSSTTVGTKVGLTLLIDFSDDTNTIPQADVVAFCNGDDYSGYGNNGSVKSYFYDNSNGTLTYSNVVTIYVRAPKPKSFYNDVTQDAGQQANLLIKDALDTLKAMPNYTTEILPSFNDLTVDSRNRVIAFNVFYTGDNGGSWALGLWPHSGALYDVGAQTLSSGGKSVYRYQITNIGALLELETFCHENGHMLCGFPDIYDYDYDSIGGAGNFCLMGYGGDGRNPPQICAYLKRAAGWATTTELTSASNFIATISASAGADFNHFYRYAKPAVDTEYYLVECRYRTNRDASLPASGVAVWHIDELGDRDNQNLATNTIHANYEVTLVQADNLWHFENDRNYGDSRDLYYLGNTASGYSNVISDTSSPNAHWWNGSYSDFMLSFFSKAAPTMTFVVGTNPPWPVIVSQPLSQVTFAGASVAFSVTAKAATAMDYQWRKNGADILGATGSSYTIPTVRSNDAGAYSVFIANVYGTAISSSATLTVVPSVALPFALNNTNLTWTTDAAAPWFGQTAYSHDSQAAGRCYFLTNSQQSSLTTTVTGPGALRFWWRVSSQPNSDVLSFSTSGTGSPISAQVSGEVSWQEMLVFIPSGPQTLRWTYAKDAAGKAGLDAAFVDQVSYTPGAVAPLILQDPVSQTTYPAQPVTFQVTAGGTPPLQYQWCLNGIDLAGATSSVLTIANPGLKDMGRYYATVRNAYGSVTSAVASLVVVPLIVKGDNSLGQLNTSPLATNVIAVAAGAWHNLVLRDDGAVLAWTEDMDHQSDVPANLGRVIGVAAGWYHSLALRLDGTVAAWGAGGNGQNNPPAGLSDVKAVAGGGWHSLALRTDGTVVAWGDNSLGQCRVPPGLMNITAIAAGAGHSLALRGDGTVVAWGDNLDPMGDYAGQAAVPSGLTNVVAIAAGDYHSLAVRKDGTVVGWGDNSQQQATAPSGLSNVVAVAGGGGHTVALKSDGTVTAWGNDWNGQCSFPNLVSNVMAVAAGNSHTVLLVGSIDSRPQVLYSVREGGQFRILVQTVAGRDYALECLGSLPGTWTTVPGSSLRGNGARQFLVDPAASGPQQFYRIRQW